MDTHDFDALVRTLSGTSSRRAAGKALFAFTIGGALAPLLGLPRGAAARRKKKRQRKDCRNCGAGSYCENRKCTACKVLETACTADIQCCSGICDSYTDRCAEVRFGCDPKKPGQCANNGICCDFSGEGEFVCADDPMTNQKACGTSCENYVNCYNQGDDAQCRNGQCCCAGPNCSASLPPC